MRDNPYKRLPPLECKPDGTPYRMTTAQRKQANALSGGSAAVMITGIVSPLMMAIPTPAPRPFLSRSAVNGFGGRSCRLPERWKRRFTGTGT